MDKNLDHLTKEEPWTTEAGKKEYMMHEFKWRQGQSKVLEGNSLRLAGYNKRRFCKLSRSYF
jgi:hypothetical protein